MSLLFTRTARNFVRHGYFPTDEVTMARVLNALKPSVSGKMQLFDPCAGEGSALLKFQEYLGHHRSTSYGIELDGTRASNARGRLDHLLEADFMDCIITPKSMSLLFLNPPYGDLASDVSADPIKTKGRRRLEKIFYQRSIHTLLPDGILVLIIPFNTLDQELAGWISKHCRDVRMFLAPEQQYHQLVIFGVRKGASNSENIPIAWQAIKQGKLPPELPINWDLPTYQVPAVSGKSAMRFATTHLDVRQLGEVVENNPCLWEQFNARFVNHTLTKRRPLLDLSHWHLALALAAGQVSGLVKSRDGRRLLIKGDTFKTQIESITYEAKEDGSVDEIRTLKDRFIPIIRAIDVTENSSTFGNIVTIR